MVKLDTTPTSSIGALRNSLAEAVNMATYQNQTTIITKHGKPVAALVSIQDFSLLKEKGNDDGK